MRRVGIDARVPVHRLGEQRELEWRVEQAHSRRRIEHRDAALEHEADEIGTPQQEWHEGEVLGGDGRRARPTEAHQVLVGEVGDVRRSERVGQIRPAFELLVGHRGAGVVADAVGPDRTSPAIVEQHRRAQPVGTHDLGRLDDEVDLAAMEQTGRVGVAREQVDAKAWTTRADPLDHRSQQHDRRVVGAADRELARVGRGIEGGAVANGALGELEDLADLRHEELGARAQLELAPDAHEQWIVEDVSQLRQRRTRRGLAEAEAGAGPRDVALGQ